MTSLRHTAFALFTALCVTLGAGYAQEKIERDKALPAALKELKKAAEDRKKARDPEAIQKIDGLVGRFDALHPKDQGLVVKELGKILTSGRVKREPAQKRLFVAAAFALGQMGSNGARALATGYASPKFKGDHWVELRAVFLTNIGKTKDERQVKFLVDRATDDPSDHILRAAGEALGNFAEAKQKVRKEIAKELIQKFNEIDGQSRASLDPGDPQVKRAKERLAAVSRDWNQTLSRLTGQDINSAPEWRRFWNKHKNANWDKA